MIKAMKKWIIALFIVVLCIGIYTARTVDESIPQAKQGPIVIFGDSLVAGIGATEGNDLPSQLEKRLGKEVINAGVSGDSTERALGRINEVAVLDPGIVVVIVGGNDYLRKYPKETTLANISEIIDKLHETGASVVLAGISRMVYDRDYEKIAREKNVRFVPRLLDRTKGKEELMHDLVHPNDAGYAVFADAIEPEIRKLLGQ